MTRTGRMRITKAQDRKNRGCKSIIRPSAIAAYVTIAGRIIVWPLALLLLLLFTATGYLSDAIKADHSIFAFTERDSGCTGCLGPCKIAMLKYKLLEGVAITSAPPFFTFTFLPPTESLSKNEWGTSPIVITGTAQELLDIRNMANLNLSPQMMRELCDFSSTRQQTAALNLAKSQP
ncbi:hypothetical protein PC116_g14078 [Phytophthora cactorum]|uniref:Uncharacterized protein n=1 Tax=Phytophthora cactorum TaxID=29920 RepID=A0A8T1CCN2_9STRA|nr:hypothetical protein PC114_g11328 [Phytophthora cactorum]KAG2919963.1 hypothetical protein PC115_g9942 [Phytophthora cactorum]KAG4237887.1 hypothetical protein PC116_g14078 [Phytophthora cactorum]